ncbi:MAG: hypothetical protein NZ840_08240 [Anaerolineales bacterium]|nr:hypothetical protein [Anaerolineales bacterium]MDW8162030.1 hypothetical protein [Anaerolineales bacterium]
MKSRHVPFLLAIGLPLVLVGGILYQRVSAQGITLREVLKLDQVSTTANLDTGQQETSDQVESSTTQPEQFPNSVFVGLDQKKTNEDIIAFAKEITTKANQSYLTPGWLHIQSQIEFFFTMSATLPDGSPIPTKSINDLWVLLDSDGYALKAVVVDDTGNPVTSQTTVFQDGQWTNLSIPEASSQEKEAYRPTFDDFVSFAETYKEILDLEQAEMELNGKKVILFTAREMFKEPITLGKSSTILSGMMGKYYFSLDTGLLVKVEEFHIYPSGETMLASRITLLNVEKIDVPPADILAYFR